MRDITTKDAVDEDGYTPLHRAAYSNNVDIAKILLQHGANVNARTEFEWTPLHSVCFHFFVSFYSISMLCLAH